MQIEERPGVAAGDLLGTDRRQVRAVVDTHVSRIMTKLGVHDRVQLVVIAYESAMITPGWYSR